MLKFFPTPYPGEWWYSVLCRYHVRSGNSRQQSTIAELFPGRVTAAIGSVFPNSTIRQVVMQLPAGVLNVDSVIAHNTLFPYYSRCFKYAKKVELLEDIALGKKVTITNLRRFTDLWRPSFCTQCAAEDREVYGEAFWHIEHQIPLLPLCPKHGCRLQQAQEVEMSHLGYTFYPLEGLAPNDLQPDASAPAPWHSSITKIMYDYQTLPLTASATEGFSNLAIALANKGYGVIQCSSKNTILDAKRIYSDMTEIYGEATIRQIFGDERSVPLINRLCKWSLATPERYAFLQNFAELPSEVLFSPERLEDTMQKNLIALKDSDVCYTKKQVMEQLGVTSNQLDLLAKKYDVLPFWRERGTTEERKKLHKIAFTLTDDDFEEYKVALKKSGFHYDSDFVRKCVMDSVKLTE